MSKKLIKIICVCALAVLCPLVIVGVALMSTQAVGYTLTVLDSGIETHGDTDFGGKESKVTVEVDGKVQKSNKIIVTNKKEVKVTFEGTGYDFVGWYKGKYSEINFQSDKILNEEGSYSYSFIMTKNTTLTAVRNVKTYNVTYKGNYDDTTTAIDIENKMYVYNEPLAPRAPKDSKNVLAGWHEIIGDADGVTTKVANFEKSGNVTVYPTWERQYAFDFAATGRYILDSNGLDGNWGITGTKGNEENKLIMQEKTMMYFMENPTTGYYDSNQDVCEYLLYNYTNFKTLNGNDANFKNIVNIYYQVNGTTSLNVTTVELNSLNDGVLSFADVLEYVESVQTSLDNVSLISVRYIFEEVIAQA